ncbi:MAG: LLM class flavin-dependent oxidoreductase [Anaerolineae bacterium]|nr:LLM class flavin-dependent oxidoreductase [Anaerolineae bacterium]
MAVEFGLVMPAGPPKTQVGEWRVTLDLVLSDLTGYVDSLWMTDHFIWDDNPTHECWTALTYMAARWPQLTIGPIVLSQGYRNPAMLAKMGATLQMLSRGRFIMGIGAGWKEDEYHAYGYPFPRPGIRVEQLEDTLEIMTRLWTEPGQVTYQGQHYHISGAYCEPKPDPVPPILVGGGGTKTTRLAARFADWWNMPDAPFEVYHERLQVLQGHCADLGRDPNSIRYSWFGRLALGRSQEKALALSHGKWHPGNAFVGTPEQVIEQLKPFIEVGVDHFMVEVLGLPDRDVFDMFTQEVIPAVGASHS